MSLQLQEETNQYFLSLVDHLYQHGGDFELHAGEAAQAAERAFIAPEDMTHLIFSRWKMLAEHALEDGELSEAEEKNLMGIMSGFGLTDQVAEKGELVDKILKLSRIRRVRNGEAINAPQRRHLPFKAVKGEVLVWVTDGVKLHEIVAEKSVQGGSLGFSFKVADGIYIRPSAFKARPVQTESLKITDVGTLYLTNKHLVFVGNQRNFKLKFVSLNRIEPFSDGLELQKSTATAKPFFLEGIDGWFHYNVIQAS